MKLRSIAIAVLAAAACAGAAAQNKAPRLVTKDELRVCMNTESQLLARRQALEARNKQNGEEAAAIRAEAAELAEEQERIGDDATRQERFVNRKVKPHNARVKTAQGNVETLKADLEALNARLVAYNDTCGGISYSKEDKDAILKEREGAK